MAAPPLTIVALPAEAELRAFATAARSLSFAASTRIVLWSGSETSSVRGGRSSSTWALVRRSTKGAIRRRSCFCACLSRCRSIGPAKRSAKRDALPSRPGLQARMMDQSSPRRFSTGVPDKAMRNPAFSANTAWLRLAAAFLMAWASSSTSVAHSRPAKAWPSICSSG